MKFIDTHCHLYWDSFRDDLDAVFARAAEAGVERIVIPATSLETLDQVTALIDTRTQAFGAAGIHPHDAAALPDDWRERVRNAARKEKVVAIGEIGLDYYYDFCPPDRQKIVFAEQLALAKELNLPVIIHNRDSDEDVLAICREQQDGTLRGQFHCFSSGMEYAGRVLDAGFHISFTGNVTFKKMQLDEIVRFVPEDRLLIETDAPFMTPVPHRGKRNEPAYLPLIAAKFAEARGISTEEVARITTANAERLFDFNRRAT